MDLPVVGLLVLFTALSTFWVGHGQSTFDLLSYGAKGDGETDDSGAFMKAWTAACQAVGNTTPTLLVLAKHSFKIQPRSFKGPCKSKEINIQILGTVVAPHKVEWESSVKDSWIVFSNVQGLSINGPGVIEGQGLEWWKRNGTTRKAYGIFRSRKPGPTALRFESCRDLQLSGFTVRNSPGRHIDLYETNGAALSNLNINSPGDSPNTDGIDVSHSSQISISDSFIGVGDDCIAVKGGSSYLNISQIACGPGHGISIGSLQGQDTVEEVHVKHCSFNGATNGARIKTWPGGNGYARKISFEHITLNRTRYPITIDQQYEDKLRNEAGGIKVSDVRYFDFQGTSSDEKAILLNCGSIGCSGLRMDKVHITSANPSKKAIAVCRNAQGTSSDTIPKVDCLSSNLERIKFY